MYTRECLKTARFQPSFQPSAIGTRLLCADRKDYLAPDCQILAAGLFVADILSDEGNPDSVFCRSRVSACSRSTLQNPVSHSWPWLWPTAKHKRTYGFCEPLTDPTAPVNEGSFGPLHNNGRGFAQYSMDFGFMADAEFFAYCSLRAATSSKPHRELRSFSPRLRFV